MSRVIFDEYIRPEPPRRLSGRQAAGLAVTLAAHALLIYAAVSAQFKVKIIRVEEKATVVHLAPSERIELPADYEERLASLPQIEGGEDAYWGSLAQDRRSGRAAQPSSGRSASPEIPSSGAVPSAAGEPSSGSQPDFVLSYTPGSEKGAVPGFDLSLLSRRETDARRRGRGTPPTDPRLKSYPSTDISGADPGDGYALARSATGDRVIYRGRLPAGARNFELAAWGRLVVEAIQKYWILPVNKADMKAGKVGVTVVVEKDGTVSLVRIINSSNTALLDRSALAAITASLPFPPLPDGFPDPRLEAFFLFDCHEK